MDGDLSTLSTDQLLAMRAQAAGGAAPAADPSAGAAGAGPPALPGLPAGVQIDPRDKLVARNPDGSIYGVGDFAAQSISEDPSAINIDLSASTDPDSIESYLKAHPDLRAAPDGWAQPAQPGGPSSAMAPSSAAPVPTAGDGSAAPDLSKMSTSDLLAMRGQMNGAPDPSSPQGQALSDFNGVEAKTPGTLRSALGGMTFGLSDEIEGAGAYTGAALQNLVTRLQGGTPTIGAADVGKAAMQADRGAAADFAQQHPWQNLGATVAGAAVNPVNYMGGGYIKGAQGLFDAILRSTAVGAGSGAAYGFGSGDDIGSRFTQAMQGAKTGAVVGAAVPPLGAALGGSTRQLLANLRTAPTADPLATAAAALQKIGVPLSSLPQDAIGRIRALAGQGLSPADAAVQEAGRTLPVPVPMTRGQMTGDPEQQLAENLAFRGGRGASAQRVAGDFKAQQQQALRANTQQIGADIGGGYASGRGQAGEAASDALNAARDQQWGQVNSAYDAARGAENPAYLRPGDALRFVQAARSGMANFDPLNVPRVAREVDRLQDVAAPWARDLPPGVNPDRITNVAGAKPADIRSLFESRTRLSQLRASNDPVESAAATSVLKSFDGQVNDALTNDLFHGDPGTVDLWRKAIGARADFGQTFQANDLVQKLTDRQGVGANAQLKVDPHDASNYIFGRSNLGFVGRQNLYRGLNRLRNVLGEDSDGWNRIRSEAFARFAAQGEGPTEAGVRQFSGAKFATSWSAANRSDPELVGTLFTPQERGTIDRFAAVADRVTKPVTGGDNASNTAVATRALRAVKRLPFVTIESIPFIDHFADKIDSAFATRAMRQATVGAVPRRVVPLPSALAGQAATAPVSTGTTAYMLQRNKTGQ